MHQHDAPFIEERTQGVVIRALRVLGHGAAYTSLYVLSILLFVPLRLVGIVAFLGVVVEGVNIWMYLHIRHDFRGAAMSVLMLILVSFVAGALLGLRSWLTNTRTRWS